MNPSYGHKFSSIKQIASPLIFLMIEVKDFRITENDCNRGKVKKYIFTEKLI